LNDSIIRRDCLGTMGDEQESASSQSLEPIRKYRRSQSSILWMNFRPLLQPLKRALTELSFGALTMTSS
jgi:hypothetical protein